VIGLLAATLFTVDSVTSRSPAEARCMGVNNPVTSWFAFEGIQRVSETPGAGTCNGNNIYSGVVKDERQDGFCAGVFFKETGSGGWGTPPGGVICGVGHTSSFQWEDTNGNSYVYQRLCVLRASNLVIVACGWGNSLDGYAANSGY
jgi:hypothetical protein